MYLYIGILAASLPTIVNAGSNVTIDEERGRKAGVATALINLGGPNVTVDEERKGGKAAIAAALIELGGKLIIDQHGGTNVHFWEIKGKYVIESECWEDGGGLCPNGNCLDNKGRRGTTIKETSWKCSWACIFAGRTRCRYQICCPFTIRRPHPSGGNGGNPSTEITDGTCYEDDRSRLLDDFHRSSTNTPMECKRTCAGRGYAYAGVQYTNECFCGNAKPPASRIRDSSQCNIRCPGDASFMCGGTWRMNIYTTGNPSSEITDGTCYEDDRSRLLDDFHRSSTNTPTECKKTCAGRGYAYAGVQYTKECFCGNTKPPASRIRDSSQCNIRCPGDASLKCGGTWRMNIYTTGNPSTVGCQNGDGKDYSGGVMKTRSGLTCQKWTSQWPHKHGFGSLGNHNYCRNPDGEPGVWCYTTNPKKRWELCAVPACGTKPRQKNIADLGYRPNCGAGWYDVQGQGVKNDYCRWVGNCGCRGDCSWWSCALAGSNNPNSPKGEYTEAG